MQKPYITLWYFKGNEVSDYNFKTSSTKFSLIKINSITEMNNRHCNKIQQLTQLTLIDIGGYWWIQTAGGLV